MLSQKLFITGKTGGRKEKTIEFQYCRTALPANIPELTFETASFNSY